MNEFLEKYLWFSMFSNKADQVLASIERSADAMYLPIIGPRRGEVLVELVRRIKPRRVLEVGTFIGYSTILMAKELGNDSEIITIEIDEHEAELAEQNIANAEVKPKVRVIIGDALEVIPYIKGKFDLVFLDGAKNEYFRYLRLLEDKLCGGSTIVADNAGAYAHSMKEYLNHVRNSGEYKSQFIEMNGDGIEISERLRQI